MVANSLVYKPLTSKNSNRKYRTDDSLESFARATALFVLSSTSTDFPPRVKFCTWFLQSSIEDPFFLPTVLFTDEAGLSINGLFTFHSPHHWGLKNRHVIRISHQQQFSLNV